MSDVYLFQDELVEVVQEQLSHIEDNAAQLEVLNTRINELTAENAETTSEITRLSSELAEQDVLNTRIDALTAENADRTSEIARLSLELGEKNALLARGGDSSSGLVALREELRVAVAQDKLNTAHIKRLEQEIEENYEIIGELRAPQTAGSSGFKRVLDVLEAAAAVTNRQNEWDSRKCGELVTEMVKGMLSREEGAKATVVEQKTAQAGGIFPYLFLSIALNPPLYSLQIMRPLMRLCRELNEHREMQEASASAAGGSQPAAAKKAKTNGGGRGRGGGGGGGGMGGGFW